MLKLAKCCYRKCDFRKWWRALVDEPAEPTKCGTVVPIGIDAGYQLAEHERVLERQSAHLPGGHLGPA